MKNEINLDFLLQVLSLTADISYTDIWWRTDGDYAPVSIFINCNNVFDQGFGDCEGITPQNIHLLEEAARDIRAITQYGDEYIPMLFCARVRGIRPRDEAYPENEALWSLLNDCGPYILYPDQVPVDPPPPCNRPNLNWWQRFLEFIKELISKIGYGIYDGFGFVMEKIENVL